MRRNIIIALALLALGATGVQAQTSTSPGIDVEVLDPSDLDNQFCVEAATSFWVQVFLRPGDQTLQCTPSCGGSIPGGSANLATGVIDLRYDATSLTPIDVETNQATIANQGLIVTNSEEGRIGWALAGNWGTPGDPDTPLASPCATTMLDVADWVFRVRFVAGTDPGVSYLHIGRETDPNPFALSFADLCGSPAFTRASQDIDQIIDASVFITADCANLIFADGFTNGDLTQWSAVSP